MTANTDENDFLQRKNLLGFNRDALRWANRYIDFLIECGDLAKAGKQLAELSGGLQHCGLLVDAHFEELLVTLGASVFHGRKWKDVPTADPKRVWHITTRVDSVGGHSVAIDRWIRSDQSRCYSLLLTSQSKPVPKKITDAVRRSGGEVVVCSTHGTEDPIGCSRELTEAIDGTSNVVILQLFTGDISGILPFCRDGGPLVLTYNTADHKVCPGVAVSDLFVEIRDSGRFLTRSLRGCSRTEVLPIMVQESGPPCAEERDFARSLLNIHADACCILSIGSAYKYRPMGDLNFAEVAATILRQAAGSVLLIVGPDSQGDLKCLADEFGDRVRLCGRVEDPNPYYSAADVYIEGFPFGSLTALLDARERGLPCVLAPNPVVPPYASDSPGISDLTQPMSPEHYAKTVIALVEETRNGIRPSVTSSTLSCHHSTAWKVTLDRLFENLPPRHRVHSVHPTEASIAFSETFWPMFMTPSARNAFMENLWLRLLHVCDDNWIRSFGKSLLDHAVDSAIKHFGESPHCKTLLNELLASAFERVPGSRVGLNIKHFSKLMRRYPRYTLRRFYPRVG